MAGVDLAGQRDLRGRIVDELEGFVALLFAEDLVALVMIFAWAQAPASPRIAEIEWTNIASASGPI